MWKEWVLWKKGVLSWVEEISPVLGRRNRSCLRCERNDSGVWCGKNDVLSWMWKESPVLGGRNKSCLGGRNGPCLKLWPNGVSRYRKFGNMNLRWLAATSVWWTKLVPTCGTNVSSIKMNASQRKSSHVHARRGQTEWQVIVRFQLAITCNSFWPGL